MLRFSAPKGRSHMNQYFSLQQAADQTGLSESTLRRAIKEGRLNALKVKGLVRISEIALLERFQEEAEESEEAGAEVEESSL